MPQKKAGSQSRGLMLSGRRRGQQGGVLNYCAVKVWVVFKTNPKKNMRANRTRTTPSFVFKGKSLAVSLAVKQPFLT